MCEKKEQEEKTCNCLEEIVCKIIDLQRNSFRACGQGGCDKPFLGPNVEEICYNTRPISFYNCLTGDIWNISGSTIFRLESLEGCCCTCRVLTLNNGEYTATNDYFTINLDCCSAIKCYEDINLAI